MTGRDETYRSPDGTLTLVVMHDDGDITIGFEGFAWHTHGDLLAASWYVGTPDGESPEAAARRFVRDVVSNRETIVIQRVDGQMRDVWITEDAEQELAYRQPGESLEFRHWDGTPVR